MNSRKFRAVATAVLLLAIVAIPLLRVAYATIKPPGAIAMPTEQKIFVDDYAYLDGSGSYDPQGFTLTKYSWQCGDATTYTETAADAPDEIFDGETEHPRGKLRLAPRRPLSKPWLA